MDHHAPDELAVACVDTMWATDAASRSLGMSVVAVRSGYAQVSMTVRPDMVNGFGICHGALVSAVADSAFAFACNTYNDVTVAAGFDVVLVQPAHEGDVLVATAVERVRSGRSGVYDVTVEVGGVTVAEFRGRSRSLGRPILGSEAR